MIAELNKCIGLFVISSYVDRQVREHHEMWFMMRPPSQIVLEQIDTNLLYGWQG